MSFVLFQDLAVDVDEIPVAVGVDHLLGEVSGIEVTAHVDAGGQFVAHIIFLEPAAHPFQAVLVKR